MGLSLIYFSVLGSIFISWILPGLLYPLVAKLSALKAPCSSMNGVEWPPRITLGRLLPHARGLVFKPRHGGFPSGAKKEWDLSPKAKIRVLHTAQLDVTDKMKDATDKEEKAKKEVKQEEDEQFRPRKANHEK
nr:hypothetical protein [Tanacetum cinerariifolium]